MSTLKKLSDTVRGLLNRKDAQLPGFLGNLSGTVRADDANNVYVTLFGGEVRVVYNGKVPNVPRLPVIIGYAPGSNQLQILGARDVFTRPPYPEVPPHALLHTFPGVDTIPIRGEQFLPGLVTPAGGVTVKVYGFLYQLADGWHVVPTQTVDLSAHVPSDGALYVLLQVDNTGAITLTDGTAVDTREELGFDDIPASDPDQLVVAAIKLYNSQTELIFTATDTDIVDLRWGRGVNIGASAITVADAGGYFAGANVEAVLQELGLDGRSFATTVTAMGTTTLNATSPTVQMFTGTSLHTVDLPDTSTIFTSKKFHIINRSTQVVSVRSSTGVSLLLLGPGTDNVFTCTSTADNLATSWKWSTTSEDALAFTDIGTADSSTTKHGLLRKLSGVATEFINGVGNWVALTASDIVSGTFDAARLPAPTTTTLGGVKRNTGSAGQYVTGIDSAGALEYDTPAGGGGGAWGSITGTLSAQTDLQSALDAKVALSGNETVAGVKTFSSSPIIPDEAYDATAWNGSLEPPTKNAVRDKIESMGAGDWVLISDSVLGASAANFDLTSIPGTYKHLHIDYSLRSDRAAATDRIKVVINNDTGSNKYESILYFWYHTSTWGTTTIGNTTFAEASFVCAASALVNSFGGGFINFVDYANTTNLKLFQTRGGQMQSTTIKPEIYDGMAVWRDTAAITRITISPEFGSNWVAGSRVTLYGKK